MLLKSDVEALIGERPFEEKKILEVEEITDVPQENIIPTITDAIDTQVGTDLKED